MQSWSKNMLLSLHEDFFGIKLDLDVIHFLKNMKKCKGWNQIFFGEIKFERRTPWEWRKNRTNIDFMLWFHTVIVNMIILIFFTCLYFQKPLQSIQFLNFFIFIFPLWSSLTNLFRNTRRIGRRRENDGDLWTIEKFQKKVNLDH